MTGADECREQALARLVELKQLFGVELDHQ
jgi:hypothetical protein